MSKPKTKVIVKAANGDAPLYELPSRSATVTALRWQTIKSLHLTGEYSSVQIGKVVGIGSNSVRYALRQMGLIVRPEGRAVGDPTNRKNLEDQKFGRLTVRHIVGKYQNGENVWECICECGNYKNVRSSFLKAGHTMSCGCLHKETSAGKLNYYHWQKKRVRGEADHCAR